MSIGTVAQPFLTFGDNALVSAYLEGHEDATFVMALQVAGMKELVTETQEYLCHDGSRSKVDLPGQLRAVPVEELAVIRGLEAARDLENVSRALRGCVVLTPRRAVTPEQVRL